MTTEEVVARPQPSQPSMAPDTTQEQDRHTLARREIDFTWERTQALIAIIVSLSVVGVASYITIARPGSEGFTFLVGVGNLVLGFYFGRTNHARSGGMAEGKP